MKLIDAYAGLLDLGQPVFRTVDAAVCLGISNVHASKMLNRLFVSGHLLHIGRGLWGVKGKVDILTLCQYVTVPFLNYVSLQSALYRHGIISQIPSVTYVVSLARTRRILTPLGVISVHRIHPSFFFGFEVPVSGGPQIATPEKALIDFLYFYPARSKLFRALPEVELPGSFSMRRARAMIDKVRSKQRRTLVRRLFEELVRQKQ